MESRVVRANVLAGLITLLGCTQLLGHMLSWRALRGIGAASVIAPFPKVFSDVDGLETFASVFTLTGRDGQGLPFVLELTPELYGQLAGSYNRRNVYGAALSYAPRLPEELWQGVFCYAFAADGPLRREFNLPAGATDLTMIISTRTRGRDDVWELRPECPR